MKSSLRRVSSLVKVTIFAASLIFVCSLAANAQNPPVPRPTPPVPSATPPIAPAATPRPVATPSAVPGAMPSAVPGAMPSAVPGATPPVTPGAAPSPVTGASPRPGQNVGATGTVPSADLPDDPPPVAPNFEAPVRPLPSAERVGVENANQISLTLEQAIEMALQNNNNIDVSRNNVQIAEFNLRGARGVYDPLIASENYFERATTPTASRIGGATSDAITQTRHFGSAGVSGFSPFAGGEYSTLFNLSRVLSTSTNPTLNPQYPGAFTLQYTQPLFRNFRFDANRRQIEIAKRNLSLTDAQFRQQAIDVIAQVEQAYWTLVFALRNLQVQIDAVKQARTQLESNQRLVAKGVLAPIDIIAATSQITTFEQSVYSAQEEVTRAENTLKGLLLAERTDATWQRPITPVSPITLDPPRVGLDVSLAEALKNRPEIALLDTNDQINSIDQRFYRDQTKPQIDLVGTYTSQGLAGTEVIPDGPNPNRPHPNLVGGPFTSLGQIARQDYPTYRASVVISLPWGNRVAKANLGRTLVEADRLKNQRATAEQLIEAEVRNAIQALRSSEARLASALAAREAAEQLYASEQRQFGAGTTTLYLVLQRQNDLLAARGRELQAQTDLNRAISEFQRATGSTLSANNVTVSSRGTLTSDPFKRSSALFYKLPTMQKPAR